MKLHLFSTEFSTKIGSKIFGSLGDLLIETVVYDSRKILNPKQSVFFALKGDFRNGHEFIKSAYEAGIRIFVLSEELEYKKFPNAQFHLVDDVLKALQKLAQKHRQQYAYPVVAITGSVGKTTVKEWIYHLLADDFSIVRSPKSYNSQLGVALSLLEMNEHHQLALIEAGISKEHEMDVLQEMIQPTVGVFTAFGSAHELSFSSKEIHLKEKEKLFSACQQVFINEEIQTNLTKNYEKVDFETIEKFRSFIPFQDKASLENLSLAIAVCSYFKLSEEKIIEKIKTLPRLALRMETFEGKNGNTIINDAYNADLDALIQSLEYQKSISNSKNRIAFIGTEGLTDKQIDQIKENVSSHQISEVFFVSKNELPAIEKITNSVILIKGTRLSQMQRIANLFQLKKHKTRIEINLTAIKHNLNFWKNQLRATTKLLVMVKASSYGSGAEKMSDFLEKNGVDYLGVAYVDEGIELRKIGCKLPILVMNADEDSFSEIVQYQLEPAIYSFSLLDSFIKILIDHQLENFPIHLKFETGMNRLGFEQEDVNKVIDILQTQPEVKIQSIYSHLADSDNLESSDFTLQQIAVFKKIAAVFENRISYPFHKHILNTEGISRFPEAQFDMVRLGIGLYGISVNPSNKTNLRQAISWKSIISQVKFLQKGESVGYSRTFIASTDMTIGIIPLGYADGFRRSLSRGKGGVFIDGKHCTVIGNVCMDMMMVDLSGLSVKEGAEVEIIGEHQSIEQLAKQMDTIPYEVLTSFSKRLHRVYVEE